MNSHHVCVIPFEQILASESQNRSLRDVCKKNGVPDLGKIPTISLFFIIRERPLIQLHNLNYPPGLAEVQRRDALHPVPHK